MRWAGAGLRCARMLTVYLGEGSPYAWRVFLALEHKAIEYDRRTISFSNRDMHQPEFLRMNPRHKVPVLVDDDFVLYESAAILEYLDERYPDAPRLFPRDVRERAIVRRVVREVDGYIGRDVYLLAQELFLRPAPERDRNMITRAVAGLCAELPMYEAVDGEYLCGALSAADFSLYPLLAMIARFELKDPDLGISSAMGPRLAAWMRRVEQLPYFAKTYPSHWSRAAG